MENGKWLLVNGKSWFAALPDSCRMPSADGFFAP
jgi:hypothetical protein